MARAFRNNFTWAVHITNVFSICSLCRERDGCIDLLASAFQLMLFAREWDSMTFIAMARKKPSHSTFINHRTAQRR